MLLWRGSSWVVRMLPSPVSDGISVIHLGRSQKFVGKGSRAVEWRLACLCIQSCGKGQTFSMLVLNVPGTGHNSFSWLPLLEKKMLPCSGMRVLVAPTLLAYFICYFQYWILCCLPLKSSAIFNKDLIISDSIPLWVTWGGHLACRVLGELNLLISGK